MPVEPRAIISVLVVAALVAFALYRRVRRSIGRQQLQPKRLWMRIGILSLVCVLLLLSRSTGVESRIYAAAGACTGVTLAFYALRHTRFEIVPDGRFYTPNLYIGLGVTALLIGRIAYRFMQMSPALHAIAAHAPPNIPVGGGNNPVQAFGSPTTIGLYFVVAGYYIFYYAGVVRRLQAER